jgi:hypothetical protein
MKLKNLVKKGGVADIVTLMIIVGLVIALIIAVVLPMIEDASTAGNDNEQKLGGINAYTDNLGSISDTGEYTTNKE